MRYWGTPKWATLGHSDLLWATLCYSGLLWATLGYSGLLWTTLGYSDLLWATLGYSDLLWAILCYSDLPWTTLDFLNYSGIIWDTLGNSGQLEGFPSENFGGGWWGDRLNLRLVPSRSRSFITSPQKSVPEGWRPNRATALHSNASPLGLSASDGRINILHLTLFVPVAAVQSGYP